MLALGDNVVTDASAVEIFRLPLVPLDEQLRRASDTPLTGGGLHRCET